MAASTSPGSDLTHAALGSVFRPCAMRAGKFSDTTRKCTGARKYPAIHGVEIRIRAEESESTGDANGDPHDFSVGFDREPVHFVPPKTRGRGRGQGLADRRRDMGNRRIRRVEGALGQPSIEQRRPGRAGARCCCLDGLRRTEWRSSYACFQHGPSDAKVKPSPGGLGTSGLGSAGVVASIVIQNQRHLLQQAARRNALCASARLFDMTGKRPTRATPVMAGTAACFAAVTVLFLRCYPITAKPGSRG